MGESGSLLNYFSSNTWAYPTEWSRIIIYGNSISGGHYTVGRFVWPVRGTASGIAQLWKTGQTISYYPGDDGDLEKGIAWPDPRFSDNGDGTVTDKLTSLMWLKDGNCFGPQSWQVALDKVKDFNIHSDSYDCKNYTASYTDWRLPNRKELLTLNDFSKYNPAIPEGHPFVNIPPEKQSYWSSTSDYRYNEAYCFGIWAGGLGGVDKSSSPGLYVWPVRGGPGPDLTGAWTTSLAQACRTTRQGRKCNVKGTFAVSNIGNRDAASTYVYFYLSDNGNFDQTDTPLKSFSTGKLKVGKSKSVKLNYNLTIGISASGKYVIAVMDPENLVAETNENNNIVVYGPIP